MCFWKISAPNPNPVTLSLQFLVIISISYSTYNSKVLTAYHEWDTKGDLGSVLFDPITVTSARSVALKSC